MLKLQSLIMLSALTAFSAHAAVECGFDSAAEKKSMANRWYQLGSSLREENLLQLSFSAYEQSVRAADARANSATLVGALDCLGKIQAERRGLKLPENAALVADVYAKSGANPKAQEILRAYAFRALANSLSVSDIDWKANAPYLTVIRGSTARASAIEGLRASSRGDSARAVGALRNAVAALENAPAEVKSLDADLRLAYARALYATGKTTEAVAQYEKLFTIGKPMQDALLESAWTQLRGKNYAKAIGLSHEMQTGKLARFFAPEAPAILAISLVENCRYAEAKKSIEGFSLAYGPVVEWLNQSANIPSLYELAMARAENAVGETAVPDRVWSIWASSDVMRALQSDIQKTFKEETEARAWVASEITDGATRGFLLGEIAKIPSYRAQLAKKIESHLEQLNASMRRRVAAESERLRFVRIEMNQEAGRDLVYLNAHPEIRKLEESISDPTPKGRSAKLYWGKARLEDPRAETWVDEIGGFEGKALNRCGLRAQARTAAN